MDPETRAITRRLDELLFRQHGDGVLDLAASLAQPHGGGEGVRFPIGVLVNGTIIRGSLCPVDVLAKAMDRTMEEIAPYVFAQPIDDSVRESLFSAYSNIIEVWREREAKGRQLLESKSDFPKVMDELDDQEFRDAMSATAPKLYVQLADARLEFNSRFIDVGVVRVRVEQIGAWWPLMEEDGVDIRFNQDQTERATR